MLFNPYKAIFNFTLKRIINSNIKLVDPTGNTILLNNSQESLITVSIINKNFYRKVIFGGSMALGETYVDGWWTCSNLSDFLSILSKDCERFGILQKGVSVLKTFKDRFLHTSRKNFKDKSKENIESHYDLGNSFYSLFLDKSLSYSSAFYENQDLILEDAQNNKINRILDLSKIKKGESLLEIGSGWGALAIEAANRHLKVKTITLSKNQFSFVEEKIKNLNLNDSINIAIQDYRDERSRYDAVISCEMIEAVGKDFLSNYFEAIRDCLNQNGYAVIQAITIRDSDYEEYSKNCDWIQKYIFPGGHLPSLKSIKKHVKETEGLELCEIYSFGQDYCKTLNEWKLRFNKAKDSLNRLGFDDAFQRKWNYYFSYCYAGFYNNITDVSHIIIKKV